MSLQKTSIVLRSSLLLIKDLLNVLQSFKDVELKLFVIYLKKQGFLM